MVVSVSKLNNIRQVSKTTTKECKSKPFSNKEALMLLEKELCEGMPKQDAEAWMTKIKQTCKKMGVAPKRLPINEEHQGDLTSIENSNWVSEIFCSVLDRSKQSKLNLIG